MYKGFLKEYTFTLACNFQFCPCSSLMTIVKSYTRAVSAIVSKIFVLPNTETLPCAYGHEF